MFMVDGEGNIADCVARGSADVDVDTADDAIAYTAF
jgi:hypothetical protein